MQHPFQCIAVVNSRLDASLKSWLLAASGPHLYCMDLADGTVCSQWSAKSAAGKDFNGQSTTGPQKNGEDSEQASNIIIIRPLEIDGLVVIVTAEDKCLRVLEVSAHGDLTQLSSRIMPKRPCAVALLPGTDLLLTGDKFGDVYMLPLRGDQGDRPSPNSMPAITPTAVQIISATVKTVHSGANLRTLEAQKLQAAKGGFVKTKQPLDFRHKLIIGHVSMLTDIVCASPISKDSAGAGHGLRIITADRDEHIRVSRAPPHAHIVEDYLLGHTEFVNKLHVTGNLLFSGGGDDQICVWDLSTGVNIANVDLKPCITEMQARLDLDNDLGIAVTGIWESEEYILVSCEGCPALIYFKAHQNPVDYANSARVLALGGNVLDAVVLNDLLIISIDNIHNPGSTTQVNTSKDTKPRLLAYRESRESDAGSTAEIWAEDNHVNRLMADINHRTTVSWQEKPLQALLYHTEQLRKKPGQAELD